MSYRTLRNVMLGLAPTLLFCACGSSDQASSATATSVQTVTPPASEASAEARAPGAAAPAASAANPAGTASRAFVDPVTGQVREPTPAELRALEARKGTSAPSAAINSKQRGKATVRPDGWVEIELDANSEMKGCVQKDGRVVAAHDCKDEPATAVSKP